MTRRKDDEQRFYVCGQCGDEQYYLVGEEPPVPCPDCGWNHKAREKELPAEIKLDLGQF